MISKRDFITDVYDNLMKNTQYKPTDFSTIKEECWFDCDKTNPQSAYNKLNAIPYFRTRGITRHYYKFGKEGFVANYDVRYLKESDNER